MYKSCSYRIPSTSNRTENLHIALSPKLSFTLCALRLPTVTYTPNFTAAENVEFPHTRAPILIIIPLPVARRCIQRNARPSYVYVGGAANVIPRIGARVRGLCVVMALHEVTADNVGFESRLSLLRFRGHDTRATNVLMWWSYAKNRL